MTGEELREAAKGKTDAEAWQDIISALKAAGLTSQQQIEIMRRVAIWGAVCSIKLGDAFVQDARDVLKAVTGRPS